MSARYATIQITTSSETISCRHSSTKFDPSTPTSYTTSSLSSSWNNQRVERPPASSGMNSANLPSSHRRRRTSPSLSSSLIITNSTNKFKNYPHQCNNRLTSHSHEKSSRTTTATTMILKREYKQSYYSQDKPLRGTVTQTPRLTPIKRKHQSHTQAKSPQHQRHTQLRRRLPTCHSQQHLSQSTRVKSRQERS